MKRIYWITKTLMLSLILSLSGMMVSCVDLDITPSSILTANDIYNETGITAYFAGMYSRLPMEDYKYDSNNAGGATYGYFADGGLVWSFWYYTGEAMNRNNCSNTEPFRRQVLGYWADGFKIIRQANTLIQDLPNYPALSSQSPAWIAEAKFLRAYVYFQLAKRYGGLPKVTEPEVLNPSDVSPLYDPRISHADTYDFILQDLDEAISGLPATSQAGRTNKNVAIALKSRVALHAATTARYGSAKFSDWTVDGVLLQGIPASKANGYFKQAWDAAKMLEGKYELHRGNANKMDNFAEVWEKSESNKESIWLRKYDLTGYAHSYDTYMGAARMTTNGDRFNPTLDWMELYEGLPLDANGHFNAIDADGNYIVYDNCKQLWANVEPRLKASMMLPGETYRDNHILEVRAGILNKKYNPAVDKFKKFSIDDGATIGLYSAVWNQTNYPANPFNRATPAGDIVYTSALNAADQLAPANASDWYELSPGVTIHKTGLDGPHTTGSAQYNTSTGLYGRKLLNLTMPKAEAQFNRSTQPWIEMRYAEILLNRAEAAIELAQSGETTYGGTNMLQDAFNCINDIRDRAGATLLTSVNELSTAPAYTNWNLPGPKGQGGFVVAPNRALQILRIEVYKELAFESKIYWDLLRWFSFDEQVRNYVRRGLYPFMYASTAVSTPNPWGTFVDGKYIYDTKPSDSNNLGIITFNPAWYYETIPSGELQNNPKLQPNRNN